MDLLGQTLTQLIVEIVLFVVMSFIGIFILNRIKGSQNRFLNIEEFFPEDEIFTLRQMFCLLMMAFSFVNLFYSLTFTGADVIYLAIFDIALSWVIAVTLDYSVDKNKILLILLVPFGSLTYLLFGFTLVSYVDLIHIPVFLYFVYVYYSKFRQYTDSNGLSVAIFLLFAIVFISFFITQLVEGVNPLDSLIMVSNAFTSNGYAVLGTTVSGKLNSLVLVWGGYLISGVSTATLTAAILIKHFNRRFEDLEKLIKEDK